MTRISPRTQLWLVTTTLIILHSFSSNTRCQGWIPKYTRRFGQTTTATEPKSACSFRHVNHHYHRPTKIARTTTKLFESISPSSYSLGTDEAAWKKEGERIIMQAAVNAGAKSEMIAIDWKGGHVVVTVDGSAYIPAEQQQAENDDNGDDDELTEPFIEGGDMDELANESTDESDGDDDQLGVDVVAIARGINAAFEAEGEGSLGYSIAYHHSIEVTTPGASDELSGIMFESYRGFDVILEFKDAKTNKVKKVEGKLVERDDEMTRINERGRIRKFKNELVQSVKLPKAMSEKTFANSSPNKQKKPKKSKKRKKK